MKTIHLFSVLIIFVSISAFAQNFKGIPIGTENVAIQNADFEKEVLRLVNKIRKKNHLNILIWQEDLARAARYHAQDMAKDDYMEHETYDRNDNQLVEICETFYRIEKFIRMNNLGENISAGKSTAQETVDGWMESKGHRKNILNPRFKYIGIGYYFMKGTHYQHYWVQDFGG